MLKTPRYAVSAKLGGPQTRCVQLGEEKNQFPLAEIRRRVRGRPASILVTTVTELQRILTWNHKWSAVGIWWEVDPELRLEFVVGVGTWLCWQLAPVSLKTLPLDLQTASV